MTEEQNNAPRSKAMKAALELMEIVLNERLALVTVNPDDELCQIGADAGDTDKNTARAVYYAMINAQN
jgi:hypothetical protein